jgi:hypothetical protein
VAVARLSNDAAAEMVAWKQALNNAAADQSRNRCLELVKFAEMLGAPNIADCWVAAIRFGWGQIPMYNDLKRVMGLLIQQNRSEDVLAILATLLRFEPQNPELICNYNYFALLHGVGTPAGIVKALEALTKAHPDATDYLPALATAYLMADQPASALRLIPVMKDSKRLDPSAYQGIEAAARLLTGDTEVGGKMISEVNWSALMISEKRVYNDLLNRPKFKDLPLPELKQVAPVLSEQEIPAWRKAIERLERDRNKDVLPALPVPKIPGSDRPLESEPPTP